MAFRASKTDDIKNETINLNLLVLGDQYVGKTSVLERYVNNIFKLNYLVTIGMDKRFKKLSINGHDINLFITDTAGQERFRSLAKMFYKNANGILLGFSLTSKETFESVSYWIKQIYENCDKGKIGIILFGNKCDVKEEIQVDEKQIEEIKKEYNIAYFKTSAKENINIKEAFEYLTKLVIINQKLGKSLGLGESPKIEDINIDFKENQKLEVNNTNKRKKKKKCC